MNEDRKGHAFHGHTVEGECLPLKTSPSPLKTSRLTWEQYALELARTASLRSEDPYHAVGTALLRADHTVAALGYNGAPPGVEIDWTDRDKRRKFVIHAENNALRYVAPGEVALMASSMMPCWDCILLAATYRIPRLVYGEELDSTVYDIPLTKRLAADCGIVLEKI